MWVAFEYLAWALSAIMLLWMLADAMRVNREFDEDTLLSSKEGVDELLEHGALNAKSEGKP
ncbi:hypothetical protein [Roseovarius sp.]|uniref:hypothetical protein n=1 Tax=Roseovarius sp. TaxID=1486281 RepID=UPI003A9765D1